MSSLINNGWKALLAAGTIAMGLAASANGTTAQTAGSVPEFDLGMRKVSPYDATALGIAGAADTATGGCMWTREMTYVGGRLTWRPLLQCNYGP